MLLQINNTAKEVPEGEPYHVLVDYVEGITHTKQCVNGTKCFKKDGSEIILVPKNKYEVEIKNLDFYEGFKIHAVYLLNDEGKTLRKLA